MAEDQVLTGGNSFPAASSGVGAVIFNNDDLQKAEDDAIKNANDTIAANQKSQADAYKNSQVIMKGLNLKTDGARPQDIPALQEKAQKILDNVGLINGAFNGDLSSSEAQQAWLKNVVQPQQAFDSTLATSKGIAKIQLEADQEFKIHPTYYDAVNYNQATAHVAALHADDPTLSNLSVADFLKEKPQDWDTYMDKLIPSTFGKKAIVNSTPETRQDEQGIIWQHQTTQNIPEIDNSGNSTNAIRHLAESVIRNPQGSQILNTAYEADKAINPEKIASLEQKYITAGQSPTQAAVSAKTDWAEAEIRNNHYENTEQWVHPTLSVESRKDLAYTRAAASAAASKEKESLPGEAMQVADFWEGDKDAVKSFMAKKLPDYSQVVTLDQPDPIDSKKTVKKQYNTTQHNAITDGGVGGDGRHYLVTNDSGDKMSTDNYGRFKEPETYFNTPNQMVDYLDNKMGGKYAQGVYQAFKDYNAINPDGSFNTKLYKVNYARKIQGQPMLSKLPPDQNNAQGQAPAAQKITQADFDAKWATLKSGQKLVGADGNTYTKP